MKGSDYSHQWKNEESRFVLCTTPVVDCAQHQSWIVHNTSRGLCTTPVVDCAQHQLWTVHNTSCGLCTTPVVDYRTIDVYFGSVTMVK